MSDFITLTGLVATEPTFITTSEGLMIASFRLKSSHSWFDRKTQEWVDGDANWYTVSSFRQLAENVRHSVHKYDLVVVTGKLRVQEWESGDRKGTKVEVDANSIGHDLARGRTTFTPAARSGAVPGPPAETVVATAAGAGPRNDRPADYASNLQQPFLPEEHSDTIAS